MSLSKIVMSSYILDHLGPFPRVPGTSWIRRVSSIHHRFQYYHPPPDDLEVGEVLGSTLILQFHRDWFQGTVRPYVFPLEKDTYIFRIASTLAMCLDMLVPRMVVVRFFLRLELLISMIPSQVNWLIPTKRICTVLGGHCHSWRRSH